MRILKFAKIDLIKATKIAWFFLFMPALAIIVILKEADTEPVFASLYCLFGGIIAASYPLSEQYAGESGFLELLPAKKGEHMKGHFLYALLTILAFGLLSIAVVAGCGLIRPDISLEFLSAYPALLAAALLFSALENSALCAFHFEGASARSFLRVLPAFVFFFGALFLADRFPGFMSALISWFTPAKSLVLFAASLLIFWVVAETCTALSGRRDEV